MNESIERSDVAPTQDAGNNYPVIEAERNMALSQRDSARRETARLRAALAEIMRICTHTLPSDYVRLVNDIEDKVIEALAAAGEGVADGRG